jgi:hypothetical protein
MRARPTFVTALLLGAGAAAARADEAAAPRAAPRADVPTRISLRIGGASSDDIGLPVVCVDVRLVAGLGVESCGTGAELWQHEDGRQMAHLRATWLLHEGALLGGRGRVRPGVGLAELQVGADTPGLDFGAPGGDRVAVAGPEAALQGQYVLPLGRGLEALATATLGAAYVAHARELIAPQRTVQPFVSVELGVGW